MKFSNLLFFLSCLLVGFIGVLSCSSDDDSDNMWTNGKITFTKVNDADQTLEVNQDRITDSVWITRATHRSIFNAAKETSASYSCTSGPSDTEWAYGSISDDVSTLTFEEFRELHDCNSPSIVGKDMVLHLISEDIYIDLKFISWHVGSTAGGGPGGGGFSYERASK